MEYKHLIVYPITREVWERLASNEFGRLVKRLKRGIEGTETMQLIQMNDVPHDKTVTYARFLCDYRPQKEEKELIRITVGGDRLEYHGEVSIKAAGLKTIKLLLNS